MGNEKSTNKYSDTKNERCICTTLDCECLQLQKQEHDYDPTKHLFLKNHGTIFPESEISCITIGNGGKFLYIGDNNGFLQQL